VGSPSKFYDKPGNLRFAAVMSNELNCYIEAQVHGVIELAVDVETVVIDSAFVGTSIAESLIAAAQRHGLGRRVASRDGVVPG
jgi:hypothetical protein